MKAIILAAGSGTRMKSEMPKVLHTVCGKPMLHYIIEACKDAGINEIITVIGKNAENVKENTPHDVKFVIQEEQLGTAHAVMCAKECILPDEQIIVLCGDTPLIKSEYIKKIAEHHKENEARCVVSCTSMPDPEGLGRIITAPSGEFLDIVEQRDLKPAQLTIKDINAGIYAFNGRDLLYGLEHTNQDNAQQEYYLTDVPKILKEDGFKISVYRDPDYIQFFGVNSQKQLAEANTHMRNRINEKHLNNGVTIIDPATAYIDADAEIESGVTIGPGAALYGKCKIGTGTNIRAYSVVEDAVVGKNCRIGPFAYLRPGTVTGDNCRIGNFVEVKNSEIGNNTNAAHLAYIGDAQIGNDVNFGCGAITVNYDGDNKHKTIIEDGTFIGSNVNLVAPVKVEKGAVVAAGSTITDDVPKEALAIARQRQVNKPDRGAKHRHVRKNIKK